MRALFLLASLLLLSSCSGEPEGKPGPVPADSIPPVDTSSYLPERSFFKIRRVIDRRESGEKRSCFVSAWLFHPNSATLGDGGAVTLNGIPVPRKAGSGPVTYFRPAADSTTFPARFDGGYEVFAATGGSAFPSFSDSIRTPHGTLDITYPRPADIISKETPFTIRWSALPGSTDSVLLNIFDPTIGGRNPAIRLGFFPDNGSITIPAGTFREWQPGIAEINLIKLHQKADSVAPGQRYLLEVLDLVQVQFPVH